MSLVRIPLGFSMVVFLAALAVSCGGGGGGGGDAGTVYFADADLDGYGDPAVSQVLQSAQAGWVLDSTDCDDGEAAVNPGADELCSDWVDNDCNDLTDCYDAAPCTADTACTACTDADGDGYYAVDLACSGGNDCADADSTVNPGVDADGDSIDACQDCDDADTATGTGTVEVCNDVDDDCDRIVDEDWLAGGSVTYTDLDGTSGLVKGDSCGTGACSGGTVICAGNGIDLTCDTLGSASQEVCDSLDNDCDAQVDEGFPQGVVNGTLTCSSGTPGLTCDAGYTSCDADLTNGCEVQLSGYTNSSGSPEYLGSSPGDQNCGLLCQGASWQTVVTRTGRRGRYFTFQVQESSDCISTVAARVSLNVPPGVDYDLFVTGGDSCSAGCSSTGGTGVDEQIVVSKSDDFGGSDTFVFTIEVRFYGGTSCSSWTLTVEGTNC